MCNHVIRIIASGTRKIDSSDIHMYDTISIVFVLADISPNILPVFPISRHG
jgi:hypothetical protein